MQALAIEAFQGLSASLVWPALLHSLWIGLLAASVVALVFQAGTRLSHRARHVILLVCARAGDRGASRRHAAPARDCRAGRAGSLSQARWSRWFPVWLNAVRNPLTSDRTGVPFRAAATSPSRARYVALFTGCLASLAAAVRQVRLVV